MQNQSIARFMLILGTAFVFIYFGIDKFLHPQTWIYWMPDWFNGLFGKDMTFWLYATGVSEIVIGAMVLFPARFIQKLGALLASIHLVAILTQVGWNDVAVRDIGLLAMTLALWFAI
jgi:uncharacterized membrane protein YphA (DoxX/SURF4 family)